MLHDEKRKMDTPKNIILKPSVSYVKKYHKERFSDVFSKARRLS